MESQIKEICDNIINKSNEYIPGIYKFYRENERELLYKVIELHLILIKEGFRIREIYFSSFGCHLNVANIYLCVLLPHQSCDGRCYNIQIFNQGNTYTYNYETCKEVISFIKGLDIF